MFIGIGNPLAMSVERIVLVVAVYSENKAMEHVLNRRLERTYRQACESDQDLRYRNLKEYGKCVNLWGKFSSNEIRRHNILQKESSRMQRATEVRRGTKTTETAQNTV